jgi:hypothetical protein
MTVPAATTWTPVVTSSTPIVTDVALVGVPLTVQERRNRITIVKPVQGSAAPARAYYMGARPGAPVNW